MTLPDFSGADVTYVVAGLTLLLALIVPTVISKVAVSSPIVLLAVGVFLGVTPLSDGVPLSVRENRAAVEHITEFAVLVALMGVGLALDRPLRLRNPASRGAWSPTWRLLAITMPLCIGGVAWLGWLAGLSLPAAVLLGAVLAPTDPVLASDVQVEGPDVEKGEIAGPPGEPERDAPEHDASAEAASDKQADEAGERSEVRFALTSEAGLNDGLAFPFVYLAIVLAAGGGAGSMALEWVSFHLLWRVVAGIVVGVLVGRMLGRLAFRSSVEATRIADRGDPLLALAALLTSYGAAELLQGYGFLAVFCCAMSLRSAERHHRYHRGMHELVERLELLVTLLVLLYLGVALGRGLLGGLTLWGAAIGLALVFVIRPLAGWIALSVRARPASELGGLTRGERAAVSFFGVRGVGSIYYLAYGIGAFTTGADGWLWATVAFTIVLSVVVHGVLATPVMRRIEEPSEP